MDIDVILTVAAILLNLGALLTILLVCRASYRSEPSSSHTGCGTLISQETFFDTSKNVVTTVVYSCGAPKTLISVEPAILEPEYVASLERREGE